MSGISKNTNDLLNQAATTLPDNTSQQIRPVHVRQMAEDIIASSFNKTTDSALVGLKEFSTLPQYEANQGATVGGVIYISNKITGPGAFVPADWDILESGSLSSEDQAIPDATNREVTLGSGSTLKVGGVKHFEDGKSSRLALDSYISDGNLLPSHITERVTNTRVIEPRFNNAGTPKDVVYKSSLKLSTVNRTNLYTTLVAGDESLLTYDSDLNDLFLWNGTEGVSLTKNLGNSDLTLTGNRTVDFNSNDLTFNNNPSLILENSTVNNSRALITLTKAMANNSNRSTFLEGYEQGTTTNYFKIFNKGDVNRSANNGIGFYSNTSLTYGTEYTLTGINTVGNNEFTIVAGEGHNHLFLRSGGSDVNDIGYLRFISFNGGNTNIDISRSGVVKLFPDSVGTAGTGKVLLMGNASISDEKILLNEDTYVTGYLKLQNDLKHLGYTSSVTAPTVTQLPANKDYSIHKDTATGTVYLAYNDGGTIKTTTLT